MDKKTTLEMIAAISNANGTSGFEDEVVAVIRPYAEGLGEITEDHMRNLYIRRKENNGKRQKTDALRPHGRGRIHGTGHLSERNTPYYSDRWLGQQQHSGT